MTPSSLLKTTCLALAGVATAWTAAPAQAAIPQPVDGTATATMNSNQSLTNPQFLFVSNSSDPGPVPGVVSLPASNFQSGANATASFNFMGDNDSFVTLDGSMNYMVIGLAPNGDLVAGFNPGAASAAISGNTGFDSLFPLTSHEAALISALQNPGPAADDTVLDFASNFSDASLGGGTSTTFTFFNDPGNATLTLVEFGHAAGTGFPVNSQVGTVDITLASVPEPASLALLAAPMLALLARRNRKRG